MITLRNELVSLQEEGNTFLINHKSEMVGVVTMDSNHFFIKIDEKYRSKHYAANALYLVTPYLHQTYSVIEVHIPKENEIAVHVFEHNGYQKKSENETEWIYIHSSESTTKDDDYVISHSNVLYLAGGCFWGMEKVFKILDGVTETCVGYANGHIENPTYEKVCRENTGYKETVRVTYDPNIVCIETILDAYFLCIDPTVKNAQGNDIGEQYQTGVYYRDDAMLSQIEAVFSREKAKHSEFYVELKPLRNFYEAEEYHQNYLDKHIDGYCHITNVDLERVRQLNRKNETQ